MSSHGKTRRTGNESRVVDASPKPVHFLGLCKCGHDGAIHSTDGFSDCLGRVGNDRCTCLYFKSVSGTYRLDSGICAEFARKEDGVQKCEAELSSDGVCPDAATHIRR